MIRLPPVGQLWPVPLRLRGLQVKSLVETPHQFVILPLKIFSILAHVGPNSPSHSNPFTTVYRKPSTNLLHKGGGVRIKGEGGRWHREVGWARGLCKGGGGRAVMKGWGTAKP